jgi:hypothetical protein
MPVQNERLSETVDPVHNLRGEFSAAPVDANFRAPPTGRRICAHLRVGRVNREGRKQAQDHVEAVDNRLLIMTPIVVIAGRDIITRCRPISFLDLPNEMLAMEANLLFRLPKLGEPKPDQCGEQSAGVKADPKGKRHGLSSRFGVFQSRTIQCERGRGVGHETCTLRSRSSCSRLAPSSLFAAACSVRSGGPAQKRETKLRKRCSIIRI